MAQLESSALFSTSTLATASEVLKPAKQLSLRLAPDYALSYFILSFRHESHPFLPADYKLPRTGPGSDISFTAC